jgi:tetratricopeptide (TPR) repeat protein
MRRNLIIIFALFMGTALMAQMPLDSAQIEMQKANKLYEASEYQKALEIYHKIEADYRSPILFYNIANCYFKIKEIPSAILYYERSLKYDPQNENTLANLKQAQKYISDNIQAMPKTAFSASWNSFVQDRSINFWANLSIYLMLAGFLILVLAILKVPDFVKKFSTLLGTLFILLSIFSFFLARSAKNNIENVNQAIIFTPKVDVMSEPKDNAARIFVIHDGLKVNIVDTNNEWFEIMLSNGEIGWIKKSDCKVI